VSTHWLGTLGMFFARDDHRCPRVPAMQDQAKKLVAAPRRPPHNRRRIGTADGQVHAQRVLVRGQANHSVPGPAAGPMPRSPGRLRKDGWPPGRILVSRPHHGEPSDLWSRVRQRHFVMGRVRLWVFAGSGYGGRGLGGVGASWTSAGSRWWRAASSLGCFRL